LEDPQPRRVWSPHQHDGLHSAEGVTPHNTVGSATMVRKTHPTRVKRRCTSSSTPKPRGYPAAFYFFLRKGNL